MLELCLNALKNIFKMFLPFIIIVVIWTIGKIIYRRYKYGIKYTDIVKKSKLNIDIDDDIMALTLSKLNGHFEVVDSSKLHASFIIICSHCLILTQLCNIHRGTIKGDTKSDKLTWHDEGKTQLITNPFISQEEDVLFLKKAFPKVDIKPFVVFGNDVLLDFAYHGNSICTRNKNVAYKIQELINLQEEKITKEEIENIKNYLK